MLALFLGTAALPHILIRYYTVPSPASARKSTIVAIAAIGFFYILTLFMGLGAMVSGTINPADSNMAAPLLARSFGELLFAIISAIAFATVLGTVSGLIVAASGAVAHDLFDRYFQIKMDDRQKVRPERSRPLSSAASPSCWDPLQRHERLLPGGLAFAVAASANLPAIVMLLFWKKTTARGIAASIVVGIVFAGTDRPVAGTVHTLRHEPAGRADSAQQPGHHLDPAQLHHAGGGLAADAENRPRHARKPAAFRGGAQQTRTGLPARAGVDSLARRPRAAPAGLWFRPGPSRPGRDSDFHAPGARVGSAQHCRVAQEEGHKLPQRHANVSPLSAPPRMDGWRPGRPSIWSIARGARFFGRTR
jgi:hypothetical protein